MKPPQTLDDVSLCTIVWNAEMNPAGGIEAFCHAHLNYVGEAVIYDTGSTDRTIEILRDLQSQYRNLQVVETTEFKGFSASRNQALQHVRTNKALLLDDDELLTQDDFLKLNGILQYHEQHDAHPYGYSFAWVSHYADDTPSIRKQNMFPKLIALDHFAKPVFKGDVFEELYIGEMYWRKIPEEKIIPVDIDVKHFLPTYQALELKHETLYNPLMNNKRQFFSFKKKPKRPSVTPDTPWKAYNKKREAYQ